MFAEFVVPNLQSDDPFHVLLFAFNWQLGLFELLLELRCALNTLAPMSLISLLFQREVLPAV